MGHTKAERKKLALSRQYAEARSRGRGLSPVNPTPPINPPPPAPQQNVNPTASPAVVDIPPDHGEGGHTPADPDLNDDVCYLCGLGGHLLCCDNCTLAFHHNCHIPKVDETPAGVWYCRVCIARRSVVTPRDHQRNAQRDVEEMERLRSGKRTATRSLQSTPAPKKHRAEVEEGAARFVEEFFSMDNQKQQKYLAALLSDHRVSPVLPPNSKGSICTPSPTNKYLTYNNQYFEISDPINFKPLDREAFHYFTPKF